MKTPKFLMGGIRLSQNLWKLFIRLIGFSKEKWEITGTILGVNGLLWSELSIDLSWSRDLFFDRLLILKRQ